mgnify:FL=1
MSKLIIKNFDNNKVEVDVIRYFKYKNTNYLIYTLNEIDEKGFTKLYIVKIMKQFNLLVAKTIKDEQEWKQIQQIVKELVTELKNNKLNEFVDLDIENLNDIKIKEARYFKLDKKLLSILTVNNEENQKEKLDELPSMNEISPVPITEVNDNSSDYKTMYLELKKDNDELNNIMADMLIELGEYRSKYGKLEGK